MTSIDSYAFTNCYSLESVEIPSGVTSIGTYAFSFCSSLESIVIPSGVTSIGNAAFGSCNGLSSIIVDEGNLFYDSRENCNGIIRTSNNKLITACKNTTIPSSVTSIDYAFMACDGLTSIVIPSGVTSIGKNAFT